MSNITHDDVVKALVAVHDYAMIAEINGVSGVKADDARAILAVYISNLEAEVNSANDALGSTTARKAWRDLDAYVAKVTAVIPDETFAEIKAGAGGNEKRYFVSMPAAYLELTGHPLVESSDNYPFRDGDPYGRQPKPSPAVKREIRTSGAKQSGYQPTSNPLPKNPPIGRGSNTCNADVRALVKEIDEDAYNDRPIGLQSWQLLREWFIRRKA